MTMCQLLVFAETLEFYIKIIVKSQPPFIVSICLIVGIMYVFTVMYTFSRITMQLKRLNQAKIIKKIGDFILAS